MMHHCLVYKLTALMACCNLSAAASMFSPIVTYSTGPKMLPCGTPAFISLSFEYLLPYYILNSMPEM
jgi:hypothetical protein